MKKIIIITILIIGLYSCQRVEDSQQNESLKSVETENTSNNNIKIVVVDGCEYVLYRLDGHRESSGGITHKGNCSNHEGESNERF